MSLHFFDGIKTSREEGMDCKYQSYEVAKQADIYKIQNDLHSLKFKYELDQSIVKYVYFYHFVSALFLIFAFFSLVHVHGKLNDLKKQVVMMDVEKKK